MKTAAGLVLLLSTAASWAAAPTLALLPPTGGPEDTELGLLIQARASSLLGATGKYTVFHVKQTLRMAEYEGLSPEKLGEAAVAEQARAHLGASRLGFGRLTPQKGGGWQLELWARDAKGALKATSVPLPPAWPVAIETGARAFAKGVAAVDAVALPELPPATAESGISDEAWRAYGRCYARIVRQPIGIENPTVLDDRELKVAVDSCQKALELAPDWESARAALAIALAIRGEDQKAVAALAKLSPDATAHAFYWIARFWLVTRYESNDAGAGVLTLAVGKAPNSLLLRGYLAEHLNAIGHHDDALKAWEAYLALAPDSPFVLARLGYTLARLKRNKEAVEKTQAAVDRDPSSTNLKLELASRFIDSGLPDRAIAVLTPLATPEARPEVTLRLGYAYLIANQLDQAEPLIQTALDKAQKPSEWRTRARAKYDIAKLQLRRGQPEKAKQSILEALAAGYKPYSLAREDKDLMVVARAAELEQSKKPAPKPAPALTPQPAEASPFQLDANGEIDPAHPRPPPPDGFTGVKF